MYWDAPLGASRSVVLIFGRETGPPGVACVPVNLGMDKNDVDGHTRAQLCDQGRSRGTSRGTWRQYSR
jgi:hypothetical protein